MHETHERTGATEKQIESAGRRYYEETPAANWHEDGENKQPWDLLDETNREAWKRECAEFAALICPPGTVIVPEAVLTAARAVLTQSVIDELGGVAVVPLRAMDELSAVMPAMGGEG